MPPLYEWICDKCKKKLDILRDFDGYRDPPTDEESGPCSEGEHAWDKKIGTPMVVRGAGWGYGRKGEW